MTQVTMDERTLTALQGSIAKWQAIVDGTGIDEGIDNCPLCQEFYDTYGFDDGESVDLCFECPVYQNVKQTACEGTPYPSRRHMGTAFYPVQAKRELEFLQSLLPKEPTNGQV